MSNGTEQIFLPDSASNLPAAVEMLARPSNGVLTNNTINLENVTDFTKVCRVCATVTELVIPIFSGEGLRINLADKIKRHLPIKVTSNDVLPLVVCYQCTSTLLATHELVACSLQADAALRTARAQQERQAQQRQQQVLDNQQLMLDNSEGIVGDRPTDYRRCEFCPSVVLGSLYNSHLLGRHAELLFHCDECNSYVARRQFLAHMTRHAHQYDAEGRRAAPGPPPAAAYVPPPLAAPPAGPPRPAPTAAAADSTTAPDHAGVDLSDDEDPVQPSPSPPPAARPPVVPDVPAALPERPPPAPVEPAPEPAAAPVAVPAPAAVPAPIAVPAQPKVLAVQIVPISFHNPVPNNEPKRNPTVPTEADETKASKGKTAARQCPLCPKTYTAASSYFYHLKYTHGKSREHECPTCGRRFGTRGALREHAALHEPTAGLECEQCGKRFRSKAGRYIHAQTHKDEKKKFVCAECGRAFRWRAELKRHLSRHAGARSHACACGRAFSVRADLLRHARTHGRGRAAHACPHAPCRATFAQPRYLRAHVARKHAAPAEPRAQRKSA